MNLKSALLLAKSNYGGHLVKLKSVKRLGVKGNQGLVVSMVRGVKVFWVKNSMV